jgi:osmoprotectant transport system ATP-binding protein
MLMDEPFGAIDPINREVIQDEFLRMQQTLRKTIIFVSHDLEEAVKMADKIAIFRAGALEQFSTPDTLLANPATPFIETFLGTDRTLKRLRLIRVADAMLRDVDVVRRQDPVAKAAMLLRASNQPAILVVDADGRVAGIVSTSRAATGSGSCGDVAERVPATLPLSIDLRGAVALMFTHDIPLLPCVDDAGKLKGVLTYRSIVKSLSVPQAAEPQVTNPGALGSSRTPRSAA